MKKPDFFILGAPKCGTTSLAAWLSDHPEVFLSPVKEPNFFNSDMKREWSHMGDIESYEALFQDAGPEHRAVGEATVWYLFSDVAVPNILAYAPGARFIVMLRNPVDMIRSLHEELVHAGLQSEDSLNGALDAQERSGQGTPRAGAVLDRKNVDYISCCSLGWQLERLFQRVPEDSVHLVWMEDLTTDPDRVFAAACDFLGVSRIALPQYEAQNRGRKMRWPKLKKLLNWAVRLKRRLNIRQSFRIGGVLQQLNTIIAPRETLLAQDREILESLFRADTCLLARITRREVGGSGAPGVERGR